MDNYKNVLLVGSGNLGSRYLQGISHSSTKVFVYVVDKNLKSLKRAKARLFEFKGFKYNKKYKFIKSFRKIPKKIDLAIICTCADVRLKIIKKIIKKYNIKFWILEKVLAQSENQLIEIKKQFRNDSHAFVNIPRSLNKWYCNIKKKIGKTNEIKIKVYGEKSLACNAIHYIHLLNWFTNEKIIKIETSRLNKNWYKSKRENFWDIYGDLKILFSNGSILKINSSHKKRRKFIKIKHKKENWVIDETIGIATRKKDKIFKNLILKGQINLQSEITSQLVDDILNKVNCKLPRLFNSIDLHIQLIKYLKLHWNKYMRKKVQLLPIT